MKSFADHFSRISSTYAAYRPRYPAPLFAALASAAPARRVAWDCATGTGQAALGLGRYFRQVVATDGSRAQVRGGEAHPRVRYVAATAEAAPVRSGAVDLVTVAQALHWLDLDAFYAEARRALAPEGVLAVWTYGRHRVDDERIDRVLDWFYEESIGPFWPAERRWVEAGYRGLPFPFRETTISQPSMTATWTLAQMLGYVGTWSAVVRCRESTGRDPVLALRDRLAPLWGGEARRRRIEWDLTVRAGRP